MLSNFILFLLWKLSSDWNCNRSLCACLANTQCLESQQAYHRGNEQMIRYPWLWLWLWLLQYNFKCSNYHEENEWKKVKSFILFFFFFLWKLLIIIIRSSSSSYLGFGLYQHTYIHIHKMLMKSTTKTTSLSRLTTKTFRLLSVPPHRWRQGKWMQKYMKTLILF